MTANAKMLCQKWLAAGAIEYDDANNDLPVMGLLNGLFWMFMQSTQIAGNVLPSAMKYAGAQDWQVFVVYIAMVVLGLLCVSLLRPVNVEQVGGTQTKVNVGKDIAGVVGLWKDPRLFLLIPIIIYFGLENAWVWGDFTKTIIKGSLGSDNIGFVMAIFGACDALFSLLFGQLGDRIGRFGTILIGCIAQLAVVALTVLKGTNGGWIEVTVMAILWAVGDAALTTQLYSIIAETFSDRPEAGFANFELWKSLAICIGFLLPLSSLTYTERSLMLAAVCTVGILCLAVLKYRAFRIGAQNEAKKKESNLEEGEVKEVGPRCEHRG
jgi:MFS family permease